MNNRAVNRAARREHVRISKRFGGGEAPFLFGTSTKTEAARKGYTQIVSHLLPASDSIRAARQLGVDTAGWSNLCKGSTRGCRAVCLTNSGRLAMPAPKVAAFVRSYIWQTDRELFEFLACREVSLAKLRFPHDKLVVRACGTHDGQVEADLPSLVRKNPDVFFNDYTKLDIPTGWVTDNVYRVISATEHTTASHVHAIVGQKLNIAVPFNVRKGELPATWHGVPVVDGDIDDLRFLDPPGRVVGLSYKVARKRNLEQSRGFIHEVAVSKVAVSVGVA